MKASKNEVWYNGDIFRGLIANPGLAGEIKGCGFPDKDRIKEFHDMVYQGYRETISGDRNVLFKMKELWFYLLFLFPDSEKYGMKIRKAERAAEYESAVASLFRDLDIKEGLGYGGER